MIFITPWNFNQNRPHPIKTLIAHRVILPYIHKATPPRVNPIRLPFPHFWHWRKVPANRPLLLLLLSLKPPPSVLRYSQSASFLIPTPYMYTNSQLSHSYPMSDAFSRIAREAMWKGVQRRATKTSDTDFETILILTQSISVARRTLDLIWFHRVVSFVIV